ncbi:type II secretion system secretin GspD [Ramlibacter sp. H39-3-26]|uniref:type II secretion system secretin GspD n=1 Tax=Curvibacter soli TaxID=3031331 RepID=UPI0023DBFD0D|nr:type II secretion system secretin GspD [Ramlibacter sp. H39-3-26]MDF1483910.1 type II secretion system secretin GspD [Ramlibacter sp. H39-3-26]
MKPPIPPHNAILSIAATALFTCAGGLFPLQALAQTALTTGSGSVPPREPVTLNFANAEIEAVARTMATITGRNVVVDPRVKGTMNLVTDRAVPPAVAFEQFLAALRLQGFTVVEAAGLYKVVPEADAKLQTAAVAVSQDGSLPRAGGSQIVTQIFKLNFENAANLVPVLRPLISPNNTINVNPGSNALVITDYADNLQRLARIVAAMDVANATDVEVIALQNANATDLVPLLQKLVDTGAGTTGAAAVGAGAQAAIAQGGQSDTAFKTTLLAEPQSNSVIIRAANPARVALVRALVAKLDQAPAPGSSAASGNIHVVYLKNADAAKLAITLRAAMAASAVNPNGGSAQASGASAIGGGMQNAGGSFLSNGSGGASGGGSSSGFGTSAAATGSLSSAQPSTGGQIQADPSTNSLIITAPEPQYRQLRTVIEQLDGRRAQVLVESLIVEVNASKEADFGIQWQTALGNYGSGSIGVIGNNSGATGANIVNLATGIASGSLATLPATGFNFALAPRINGKYYLGALANFLESTGDGNVLSRPNLLTLDNEEARIMIGQNVPFVTGSYANTGSSSTVSPFTTVERKDVGLTLRVKPQIAENGTVKMTVYQEVSNIVASTLNNTNGPSTSKRSIESNVLVEDGGVIVLGGLLQDDYALSQDKVPVVGDLPVVGGLFRNEKRTRAKTNLMVFLRPVVVRDSIASDSLTMDRYETIRALQQQVQPPQSTVLQGVSGAPVLPALSPASPPAAPASQSPATAPLNPAPAQ